MLSGAELEIFRLKLHSIVEEMGLTLEKTAYSTNIKIRRDYSCALFDPDLRHVAQYTAAPAQIAAIVIATKALLPEREELEPGDGILVNDPATKGSVHLPDVMLISPLFADGELIGYAANDAHHVDIGGGTPGGIPTDSRDIYGEGLILPGVKAVEDWELDEEVFSAIARNVRDAPRRRGDYRAQVGANRIGERRLREFRAEHDPGEFADNLDALLDYTERRTRAAIREFPDGAYRAEDYLDGDGVVDEPVRLAVEVRIEGDEMTLDFAGTADQNPGPLNATYSNVFAGCMCSVLSLIEEDLPNNDGFYRPFELVTPEGSMVDPDPDAPIAGGGEISQRTADLVTRALSEAVPEDAIAATKGTVCNVAYGGRRPSDGSEYVYYETFAGGFGGRATKDGMDAVQPYLQNTANSPIEELESEIPLYVRRYELIEDSEGAGRQRGGLGVRRDMEFYDHRSRFTVLADRAKFPPWGLFGGHDARTAEYLVDPDGEARTLSSKSTVRLAEGEVVSIRTPGGGGYGDPHERDPEAVLRDVVDGKVSRVKAREEYGVVVAPGERRVDEAATARLRRDRRER